MTASCSPMAVAPDSRAFVNSRLRCFTNPSSPAWRSQKVRHCAAPAHTATWSMPYTESLPTVLSRNLRHESTHSFAPFQHASMNSLSLTTALSSMLPLRSRCSPVD